jgi:serine/threonine protein kinase/Flp pilus assembly protein TadD
MNDLLASTLATPAISSHGELQQLLVEALAEYHEAADANRPIDREAFLEKYADIRHELSGYLDSFDLIRAMAPELADTSGSTSTSTDELPQRATLGDFRIVREIGRGGMGVVYEAEQISLGRRVALKVLPFAAMLDRQQLARFKNEARAAATLDHPNIVAIYSVGCERSVHYYAMQLIEGQSLAQIVEQLRKEQDTGCSMLDAGSRQSSSIQHQASSIDTAPIAHLTTLPDFNSKDYFRTIAQLGIQAAEALDHAHQNGILHRDIKPANLLVDDTGKLWITDFGLARMEADAGMTMTGDILGTLRYMSPEQALAKRVVVDHRSDIYSLGVTLYELLTLQPAFSGDDRQDLLRQIAFEEPRALRQISGRIPQDLETIVLKAIEKNPAQRYATAHELAADLRNCVAHQPIKAKPPTWRDRIVKWSRRHPAAVRATMTVLLITAIVVAAAMGWVSRDRAARQALLVEQVTMALQESKSRYETRKLAEAMSSVKRAEGLLASGKASDEIQRSVGQWRANLETVRRLEELRLGRGAQHRSSRSDTSFADRSYQEIFRETGIDLLALDIHESARRIRVSPIKDDLIAALDDWLQARTVHRAAETDERGRAPGWANLLQLVSLADPNPWRNRLRDSIERDDVVTLISMAADKEVFLQPPATITLLAKALKEHKKAPTAVEILTQAQWQHPADFWINIELANCLRSVRPQRTAEAIAFRRIAVALRPDSAVAYGHLAAACRANRQYIEAIAALRRAVDLNPDDLAIRGSLAQDLEGQGMHAEAEIEYREIIRLKPVDHLDHVLLAVALIKLGKMTEAEPVAREAIRLAPDNHLGHQILAQTLTAQQKYAEAEVAYREAVRLKPDDVMLHCRLILLLDQQGKRDDAEAELETVREPVAPDDYLTLAVALQHFRKTDKAVMALREALRIQPKNVKVINALAWILATAPSDELRNGREAVELASRACELTDYKQASYLDTLAAAYAEKGDFDAAIKWSAKALELADSDALSNELTKHLESYHAGKPWREE